MPLLEIADPTVPGGRRTISTDFPLPTSGGGGGGGTASAVKVWDGSTSAAVKGASTAAAAADPALVVTQSPNAAPTRLVGLDGVALASTANPLPVKGASSSNATPAYEKGAYAVTTDDVAQAVNAVSTNLAAQDGVDLQSIAVSLIVLSTYTGQVFFEVSNDGTNWTAKTLVRGDGGAASSFTNGSGTGTGAWQQWSGDLGARYFRVRQTAYTSGQVRVVAIASALSTSTIPQQAVALLGGSQIIGTVLARDSAGATITQKAASQAAAAADPSLVVGLSPNSPLPAGSNTIGFVGLNSTSQVGMTNFGQSGSLAALNAVVDGNSDLAAYGQVQVQVTGTWSGAVNWEVSNDGTNWQPKVLSPSQGGNLSNVLTGNGLAFGHIGARYFRARMSAFTSGTAVVTIRYNAAPGEMPITNPNTNLRAAANADGVAVGSIDEVALGAYNGSTIDRLLNASGFGTAQTGRALAVATGTQSFASLNAATAPAAGTAYDLNSARAAHTLQVDVTTTTAGTAGTHSIVLEGSLDGTYWTTLGTVSPAATSTSATDTSNHANISVTGFPYRYVRPRWASIPTSWAGSLTARVASA